jgi:4-amino-4-deoxy-L-arabinose transferase-like glycosyltransferase
VADVAVTPGAAATRVHARTWWAYALAAASVATFLAWSLWRVDRPGLQYDEAIFVNAALGADYPDRAFVWREHYGIPTMLMPYIGALKAWLYAPVFSVFGVSVETIRIPMVLLGAATIALAFALGRRLFGLWPAAVLALLLGTDTAFAIMSKADFGPVVISSFLRVAALAAYFAFVRTRSLTALWLLGLSLAVGVFNKLDYGLFTIALVVAALVVDRDRFVRAIRERPRGTLLPLGLLAVWYYVVAVTIAWPSRDLDVSGAHDSWWTHLRPLFLLFAVSISGEGPYEYMTQTDMTGGGFLTMPLAVVAVGVAAAHAVLAYRRRRGSLPASEAGRACEVLLVVLLVTSVGLALTKPVGGAQHILLLWPLPYLLAVGLIPAAGEARRRVATHLAGAFVVLAVAAHAIPAIAYTRAFERENPWFTTWSTEIYPAAETVDERVDGVDTLITADWGVGQVFALVDEDGRQRFVDLWPRVVAGERRLGRAYFSGRRVLVVDHTDAGEMIPGANAGLRSILRTVPGARVTSLFRGRHYEVSLVDG